MNQLRFHLDENVNIHLADALRRRGFDVTAAQEVNLKGRPDFDHIQFAITQARVLVTHDADFLRLDKASAGHSGIIFCPMSRCGIGGMLRSLTSIAELISSEQMSGRIEYI
ncbi:MAG TPA: DUF5615 family PIN-like protein [Phycisphaerae bacterium]|nr:DUF5615 family PIN-like protein [Phycisphaerae bacterium]